MGWLELVKDFNIPFKKGSSVNGGNIEIHCPFCGPSDRAKHLCLNLRSGLFGCWRNATHSGSNPVRAIAAILNKTEKEAIRISLGYFLPAMISREQRKEDEALIKPVAVPDDFYEFKEHQIAALNSQQSQFTAYLKQRNIDPHWATHRFNLRWAVTGKYSYRLIIPVTQGDQWYSWTGRTIGENKVRYLTCNLPNSAPTNFLFDQDQLQGGKTLVITEGPFDTIQVASCFIPGVNATSLFGMKITARQTMILTNIAQMYDQVFLCLDKKEYANAYNLANELRWYVPQITAIELPYKDFGGATQDQIKDQLHQLARR